MNTQMVVKNNLSYLDCVSDGRRIENENDALDLVAACGESHVDRLMLHADNLNADFYRLRTGLAGAVLQKFVNYHIRVAAVIPTELINQGRFYEMALEANRGSQFHIFQDSQTAERWLIGE
jgi:PadR family transcriptional regulator, regulatory protein AphA